MRPTSSPIASIATEVAQLEQLLEERTRVMTTHPVFAQIRTLDDLHRFMRWHVFAVWDFMSLVKRLQREYTVTTLPWTPPRNTQAARLITEIVLGEECDIAPDQGHASHFDLYLMAMREVRADTAQALQFIEQVREGAPVDAALRAVDAPRPVASFVESTIRTALEGSTLEVLGSFLYGREDVIPRMFRRLLDDWSMRPEDTPIFVFYLERHIELDTESHGPAAQRLIEDAVAGDPVRHRELLRAALDAVEHRIALWDGLQAAMLAGSTA